MVIEIERETFFDFMSIDEAIQTLAELRGSKHLLSNIEVIDREGAIVDLVNFQDEIDLFVPIC
jgi:hypothetical protein